MNRIPFLFSILFILFQQPVFAAVVVKNDEIILENDKIKKVIVFKKGTIKVQTLFAKDVQWNVLAESSTPWFEFVLNGKLLNAQMPIWKYKTHVVRKMSNGGEELKLTLSCTVLPSLAVDLYQQTFSGTSLQRESIELRNIGSKSIQLNKYKGKLHFLFPQYSYQIPSGAQSLQEIRLATFGKELLPSVDPATTYDDRKFDGGEFFNLAQAHMFHPEIRNFNLQNGDSVAIKGCLQFFETPNFRLFTAYEHASQDNRIGFKKDGGRVGIKNTAMAADASQGVEGESGLPESDDDFWFLAMQNKIQNNVLTTGLSIIRGGYLDGEEITKEKPYASVWSATGVLPNSQTPKEFLHDYLWKYISEHAPSRKQEFYYNTWGMQRDARSEGKETRSIMTEARILEEINYASEMGVDIVVLDDGWEQTQGDWVAHKERLPNGLKPLVDAMRAKGITPGIWQSPMGIDSNSERYKQHKNWVILDGKGHSIKAQWGHPAFDFVGGFYDVFLADCKKLIDQGFYFFKWDAINSFSSTLAGLDHGTDKYSRQEIKERYDYMLPFYVTKAMKELRLYNPKVVVEIDLTEPERCLVGLMPLQEGKFFWMNNGASGYNDYSHYRTKSMRTIVNEYKDIIPYGIFTFSVYPHNAYPYFAQRYNVNTTLCAGKGFWGNLKSMNQTQRLRIGEQVKKHKMILPYVEDLPLEISGKIGESPEWYTQLNASASAGQVIGFSGSAKEATYKVKLEGKNFLTVLNHRFELKGDSLQLSFQFTMPDDTREAFILPNQGTGIQVQSSSTWLDKATLNVPAKSLELVSGSNGTLVLNIPNALSSLVLENAQAKVQEELGFKKYTIMVTEGQVLKLLWK